MCLSFDTAPLLYHIANRLLNQFVNFLNMEIQMI